MDADGSNIKRLADRNSEDFRPEWSPDGSWVAFTSDSDGTNDIYVVKPDGSELTQVTHTEGIHEAWGRNGLRTEQKSCSSPTLMAPMTYTSPT